MRALTFAHYGAPLSEDDVDEPVIGDHDVLISVVAAGLNQLDEKIRLGEFKQLLPYKGVVRLGHDVAGVVMRTGSRVSQFKSGDAVYSRPRDGRIGTFAERIAVHEDDVALSPRDLSPVEAASLPLVALTAWQALVTRGKVGPGKRVLIHAGSGGVGIIAIQLAKHLGAFVATTASASNTSFLEELGADTVVDYRNQDFSQELSDFDLVLDSVGGENVEKSLKVLKRGGKVIGIAGPPTPDFAKRAGLGQVVRLVMAGLSRKVRRAARRAGVTYEFLFMEASGDQLRKITELVDSGAIRPVVDSTIRFEDVPEALQSLGKGGTRGKTVAVVSQR